jgi:hypothetical protein
LNRLKAAATDAKGRKEIPFETAAEIGFGDFNGTYVTFERAQAQIILGAQVLYLAFTGLGRGARVIPISHGVSFGIKPAVEAYAVSGALRMIGPYPSDTREYDREGYVQTQLDRSLGDSITISFPTQKSDVPAPERLRLQEFVKT